MIFSCLNLEAKVKETIHNVRSLRDQSPCVDLQISGFDERMRVGNAVPQRKITRSRDVEDDLLLPTPDDGCDAGGSSGRCPRGLGLLGWDGMT